MFYIKCQYVELEHSIKLIIKKLRSYEPSDNKRLQLKQKIICHQLLYMLRLGYIFIQTY